MRQKERGRSEGETRATIVNYTTMCNKTWPKGLGGLGWHILFMDLVEFAMNGFSA